MIRRIVLILIVILAGMAISAPAQGLNFVGGYMNPTCTNVAIRLTYNVTRDNTGTGNEHYAQIVTDGYGTLLAKIEYTDRFNGTDNYVINYIAVPAGNPITARFMSYAGNGLGEETYYTNVFQCPGLPDIGQGPSIPNGFKLHAITCDVAVYATAGGIPVLNGAHVQAGQTWFVNPTPVNAPDGQSWTEIFVSGYTNGYIPTSCVGTQLQ